MNKVLITGASGFIGKNIAQYLDKSRFEVYGTYRRDTPLDLEIEYLQCDLANEEPPLQEADIIIHCAAEVDEDNVDKLIQNNILATKRIAAFAEKAKVEQIIYLSTVSIYGKTDTIVNESSPRIDPGIYGMSKYIAEEYIMNANVPLKLTLRLPRIIGEGCDLTKPWIPTLAGKLIGNEKISYFNPEKEYNNFMHVNDLSSFILKSIAEKHTGIIGLASIESLKILDVIQTMKSSINSTSELEEKMFVGGMQHPSMIDVQEALKLGFTTMEPQRALKLFCAQLRN